MFTLELTILIETVMLTGPLSGQITMHKDSTEPRWLCFKMEKSHPL